MIDRLEQGKPLIAALSAGDFTDSGHFIVISGYKDGSFAVNDPNSLERSAKGWTFEQLSGQIRVIWAFSRTGEG
jgi:predicted double-glycine peptidase